ncbi:MAG: hypothetical protein ACNA8W_16625, partial [Bradymonadaceae bacterium]
MTIRRYALPSLVFSLATLLSLSVAAQDYESTAEFDRAANMGTPPTAQEAGEAAPNRPAEAVPRLETTTGPGLSVTVHVEHATDAETDLAGIPVILQAARARGPFETAPAQAVLESTAVTDPQGRATFDDVPASIIEQGLRLYASANFGGVSFASTPIVPSNRSTLRVRVHDKGHDVSAVHVSNLRVILEPWESYLVFTQYWTIAVDGDLAIDTSMLPGRQFERGLPLRLPVKGEGIHANGPGRNQVVNNVVFWNGVLKPGRPVTLQIRFSIKASHPTFVYEQEMGYETRNVELVAPLQTQFRKIPRLDDLEMTAPGFEVGSDASALGLRQDMEFLIGNGHSVDAGESFRFQL